MLIELVAVAGILVFLFLKSRRDAEYHKIRMVNAHMDSLKSLDAEGEYRRLAAQEVEQRFKSLHHDKLGDKSLPNL